MRPNTVLVVDDDEDLRDAIAELLRLRGFEVTQAANGRDALERIAQRRPGVILLDMKMPVMNGWDFARAFRQEHDTESAIVVITAAADAQERAAEIGADGWLGKPFESADLYAAVGRHLGAADSRPDAG